MTITDKRSFLVLCNIIGSFFAKGISALVVLMMVPLTLHCLGEYKNGVWLTVSGILVWIDQMDIGLGNGLRNKLSEYIALEKKTEARTIVSSTLAMLVLIITPLLIVLSLLIWNCDVWKLLNVIPSEVPELPVILQSMLLLVSGSFVMKFIGNVYMGMQLPSINNMLISLGQAGSLVLTWILWKEGHATFLNIAITNTLVPLLVWLIAYPITFHKVFPFLRPSFAVIKINLALELGQVGLKFFWLQIAAIIQFSTANLLISHFFSPEMVTPFQVAYRYMSVALIIFSIACMPLWNATTDAYAKGDFAWIKKMDKKMNLFIILLTIGMTLMTIISPWVYKIWIGDETHVPSEMTVLIAVYVYLLIVSMRYSYILNGMGALKLQMYMTICTVIYLPLTWWISTSTHNILYFLIILCISNLPGLIVNAIQYNKLLNNNATGIWKLK